MVIAWRRTALMVDDYRRRVGYRSPTDAIGQTPIERGARRAYQRVERAIAELADARTIARRDWTVRACLGRKRPSDSTCLHITGRRSGAAGYCW